MAVGNASVNAETSTSDREIIIFRTFDAPRELVFTAWTDPSHLIHWWGPTGFTTRVQEMNVRPGGVWRLVMRGPDGREYKNRIIFLEVVKPARLVYKHDPEEGSEPVTFETTVTFTDEGRGKTKVTMRMSFPTEAERDLVVDKYGAIEGGNQTLGRLAEYLPQMDSGSIGDSSSRQFVFTRVFDAPRDLVWKAFTEPERLMQWWGPKGFKMLTCKVDPRPGGIFHYGMRSPDGRDMWGKWVYREIAAPERMVTVVSFTDEEGNPSRHPMNPAWPLEVLHTMTLSERDGKTTLTVYGIPVNASEAERKTFEDGLGSMERGFTGTLNQLADYLAKA